MAERKVIDCDKCGSTPAEPWSLGRLNRAQTRVDLCEECSKEIVELRKVGRPIREGEKRPYRTFKKSTVKSR